MVIGGYGISNRKDKQMVSALLIWIGIPAYFLISILLVWRDGKKHPSETIEDAMSNADYEAALFVGWPLVGIVYLIIWALYGKPQR